MVLSLEQIKKELVQEVCGNYAAALYGCNTNEDVKLVSREIILKITQKAQLGDRVEAVG